MGRDNKNNTSEKGNVLFLILIAVALFAALSYAVTKSTRSGGGSTEREKAILSGASMTQHPTALRTAVIRMILGGVDVSGIRFNSPANFSAISGSLEVAVFHPDGGGAVFQNAPSDVMAGTGEGTWFFNGQFEVPNLGVDGATGNDLIAFLPNVSRTVCTQVNREFSIDSTDCTLVNNVVQADGISAADVSVQMDDTYTFPPTAADTIEGLGGSCEAFVGQPSGCFIDDTGNSYVFYSVLLER